MYSEIKIYGGCDVNYVISKQDNISMEEINNIALNGIYTPVWDNTTITLSTFKEDISASDISQAQPIVGYIVHRRDSSENIEYFVAELPPYDTYIQDYNIGNRTSYFYNITPLHEDVNGDIIRGAPIITDVQNVNWYTVSIMDLIPTAKANIYNIDNENMWLFGCNIEDITYKPQTNKTLTAGMNRYPKMYTSETNYLTGDISCLIGNIDCSNTKQYANDNVDKLNKWVEFCNNGQLKLLRDVKGHIIPCEITDTSYTPDSSVYDMPTTISFSFAQLLNSKDISIYSLEENHGNI